MAHFLRSLYDREAISIHEASHLAAAAILGASDAEARVWGRGYGTRGHVTYDPDSLSAEDRALVALASGEGMRMVCGLNDNEIAVTCRSDLAGASRLLGLEQDSEGFAAWQERARDLLADVDILALAGDLVARGGRLGAREALRHTRKTRSPELTTPTLTVEEARRLLPQFIEARRLVREALAAYEARGPVQVLERRAARGGFAPAVQATRTSPACADDDHGACFGLGDGSEPDLHARYSPALSCRCSCHGAP